MLRYIASAVLILALTPALAGEPCCGIVSVDAARKLVAIQASGMTKGLFEVTVADAAQLRSLAKGQPVSLSGSTLTLLVHGNGATPQSIRLTNVRYVASAGAGPTTGAVASAASSPPPGDFRRDPTIKGGCPALKETPTQQCVLTQDNSSSGRGCEYFCVSLR